MARREFKGAAAATTLSAGITNASTTITIADATNWPDGSVGPFAIVIGRGTADEEKVLVTSRSGTNLTCLLANRGYDDTSATSHSAGVAVEHCLTSVDLDEANEHINDTAGAHAATAISAATHGSIAGTTVQAQLEELESEKAASGHSHGSSIEETLLDAKGDIIVATAADTAARKAVGSNGAILTADSGQADGLAWRLPATATVATTETTTTTTYTDLATAGPAVTATVGASGMALVIVTAETYTTQTNQYTYMSYAVSGASTVAASDARALVFRSASASGQVILASAVFLHTGLTAGSNTFTAKYRSSSASVTNSWANRSITVIPL